MGPFGIWLTLFRDTMRYASHVLHFGFLAAALELWNNTPIILRLVSE